MSFSTYPTPTKFTIAGLLLGAVGILLQYLTLPEDFPAVPPGPIIVMAAAVFVTLGVRWWWSSLVGVAVALMILIGGTLDGGLIDNLSDFPGPATGAVLMLMGLVTALIAGVIAATTRRR